MLPYNSNKHKMIDAINNPITVGYNSLGLISSGNIISQVPNDSMNFAVFAGVITTTGPKGTEPDYTDYRYWIQIQQNNITSSSSATSDLTMVSTPVISPNLPNILTAYSFSEYVAGSHSLAVGQPVTIMPIWFDAVQDNLSTPFIRYMITGGGGSSGTGQYQMMVNCNVTDNQMGSSFLAFHESIS